MEKGIKINNKQGKGRRAWRKIRNTDKNYGILQEKTKSDWREGSTQHATEYKGIIFTYEQSKKQKKIEIRSFMAGGKYKSGT